MSLVTHFREQRPNLPPPGNRESDNPGVDMCFSRLIRDVLDAQVRATLRPMSAQGRTDAGYHGLLLCQLVHSFVVFVVIAVVSASSFIFAVCRMVLVGIFFVIDSSSQAGRSRWLSLLALDPACSSCSSASATSVRVLLSFFRHRKGATLGCGQWGLCIRGTDFDGIAPVRGRLLTHVRRLGRRGVQASGEATDEATMLVPREYDAILMVPVGCVNRVIGVEEVLVLVLALIMGVDAKRMGSISIKTLSNRSAEAVAYAVKLAKPGEIDVRWVMTWVHLVAALVEACNALFP
ncbi:hypothetical protein DL93DRAFT_2160933 [Clavulina sp. PMI_390]|nr:hypothetical protein DL93DRAFT_2160933 [Clavulina sp. PMI_390]